ncbi:MAG: uracil phosphoribosyltransferase [Bacteroidota bacterium]
MTYNFSDHNSIVNRFVAELRDVQIQKDRMRFRRNLERIAEVIAYEISKQLDYELQEVETPLGIAKVNLSTSRVVIASILRAGLPFHHGFLNYFDAADNAFISAYRRHHKDGSFEINLEYVSCPDLTDTVLILADPMLATGASMDLAIKALQEYGQPRSIHLVTAIASSFGFNYIKRLYPKASLWVGAIDDELTARSYIVPGLGDAGDLSFGGKLQD